MRFVPFVSMAFALALCACGDKKGANDPSKFDPNQCQPGQPCPPQPYPCQPGQPCNTPYPCQPGQPCATPCQPGQPCNTPPPPPPPPASAGQAQPLPIAALGGQLVLDGLASKDFPGYHSESTFVANFQSGQTFEQPFTMQPGKCYGVIALGLTAQQVDLQIVINQPPVPPAPLAQSSTTGPQAEIGQGGNCVRSLIPTVAVPAKVVMKVTGTSIAGGEILSK